MRKKSKHECRECPGALVAHYDELERAREAGKLAWLVADFYNSRGRRAYSDEHGVMRKIDPRNDTAPA